MSKTSPSDVRRNYYPAIATIGIVVLSIILLRSQGRLWICECGRVDLWAGNTKSSDNSQHIFDPYSFTHLLHGVIFYGLATWLLSRWTLGWKLWAVVTVEAAWEVIENSEAIIQRYRETALALGYNGDTIVNSVGDIACCVAGFYIARHLGFRRSAVLFIITEVILIIWIRDSLVLNIISLLYPLEALGNWQRGS